MENASLMFERVCELLRSLGFHPDVLDDNKIIQLSVANARGHYDICLQVRQDPSLLEVAVPVPVIVEDKFRIAVAELIARANRHWPLGHLSLDMTEGLLGWNAAMPLDDGDITTGQLRHLLLAGTSMVGMYLKAINRLIYGDDLSPAEVIAEVEMAFR